MTRRIPNNILSSKRIFLFTLQLLLTIIGFFLTLSCAFIEDSSEIIVLITLLSAGHIPLAFFSYVNKRNGYLISVCSHISLLSSLAYIIQSYIMNTDFPWIEWEISAKIIVFFMISACIIINLISLFLLTKNFINKFESNNSRFLNTK